MLIIPFVVFSRLLFFPVYGQRKEAKEGKLWASAFMGLLAQFLLYFINIITDSLEHLPNA